MIEFILKFVSSFSLALNFLCLFLFYFPCFFFNVHPSPAIHLLATNVNGALLLTTGVTTLFRNERRTTPLITLALFVRVVILIAGVRKHEKHFIGILFNSFQNKYVKDAK